MSRVMLQAPRGEIQVVAQDPPRPAAGEVLVKMEACGICHSDLFVAGLERLPLTPLTLGHEGVGRVIECGPDVDNAASGDRVGITFLAATCAECDYCRSGRERFCPKQWNSGYTVHGALADIACVRAQRLVKVPEGIDAALAAPLCCAGWTAYGALREAAAAESVAIFGMGGLGHLAVQYARHRGLRVAVADLSEEKLEQARSLGAELAVAADNAGKSLQKLMGGVDAAIVLTGSPTAIQQAFRSVKRTGTVVLVGLTPQNYELPIVDTVLKGIRIQGSYLGTRQDLEEVLRLGAVGTVQPHVERFPIAETPRLLESLKEGKLLGRAVIQF